MLRRQGLLDRQKEKGGLRLPALPTYHADAAVKSTRVKRGRAPCATLTAGAAACSAAGVGNLLACGLRRFAMNARTLIELGDGQNRSLRRASWHSMVGNSLDWPVNQLPLLKHVAGTQASPAAI